MTQQALPSPVGRDRPTLLPYFEGAADATHTKHRVQRRDLCSACVFMLHATRENWAPSPAVWVRKRPADSSGGTATVRSYALLCSQHHMEWKERDDTAKAEAKERETHR